MPLGKVTLLGVKCFLHEGRLPFGGCCLCCGGHFMTVGAILRAVLLFLMAAIETCKGKDCGPLGIEVAAPPFSYLSPFWYLTPWGLGD